MTSHETRIETDPRTPATGKKRTRRTVGKRPAKPASPLQPDEVLITVCSYFCSEGLTAPQIKQRLAEEHGVAITREEVYRLVRVAASRGWIRFTPPPKFGLQRQLKDAYPWLQDVSVVPTARSADVAQRGAEQLRELLQQHYAGGEVHIGFSGGTALRTLAQRFSELLREPALHLPRKIVFHALVAGFDVHDPTTDPNAFFTYFVHDSAMEVETSFVALYAPAMVEDELEPRLKTTRGIEEPYARAAEIDVFVTSATSWQDRHSILRYYMDSSGGAVEELEKAGCLGDILWQPIGPKGPLDTKARMRAMTLLKLGDVSQRVADKKHVLLVAGPCAKCHTPKSDVVKAILDQDRRLITHLVVDGRCARTVLARRQA